MIDYVKILLQNVDAENILQIPQLEFKVEVSEKTGLFSTKHTAQYHYCKITIYDSGIVLFSGSIHKLWNSMNNIYAPNRNATIHYKGFNGNQFTLNNILEVIGHLEHLFNCSSETMIFQNIELGINTTPGYDPKLYTKGLLYHKSKPFEYRYNNNFAQAVHQKFIFKIYNKSHQYGMQENVLRVELKIIKTSELKTIGLRAFCDVNEETMRKAKELLLKRFDEVVHYDYTTDKNQLTDLQKRLVERYCNPRFWINELKSNHRDRHKKRLHVITHKYSDNLHQKVREDIIEKCVMNNRLSEKQKCVINTTSSIGVIVTQTDFKKCPISGLDLKHEKRGAKYIRTTTLRYLHQYDQRTFIVLCSLLLSHSMRRPKHESSLITHLAKQIRNRYYNPIQIKQTGYNERKYLNQLNINF